jgi:hypothetical protein
MKPSTKYLLSNNQVAENQIMRVIDLYLERLRSISSTATSSFSLINELYLLHPYANVHMQGVAITPDNERMLADITAVLGHDETESELAKEIYEAILEQVVSRDQVSMNLNNLAGSGPASLSPASPRTAAFVGTPTVTSPRLSQQPASGYFGSLSSPRYAPSGSLPTPVASMSPQPFALSQRQPTVLYPARAGDESALSMFGEF